MPLHRVLPDTAERPFWSSRSFLFYVGVFVALSSASALLTDVSGGSSGLLAGWSAFAAALATLLALALQGRGAPMLAALVAFVAVAFVGTGAVALADRLGIAPETLNDYVRSPGAYLVELAVLAAGLAAVHRFRHPLLMLPVAGTVLISIVTTGSSAFGGDSGAGVPSLFSAIAGTVLVWAGIAADRAGRAPYGFWPHVLGGLALAEAAVYVASRGEGGWFLLALASLASIGAARALGRSSYAVVGAAGVLAACTHWIERGLGPFVDVPIFGEPRDHAATWKVSLAYLGVALVLVLLGVVAGDGRRDEPEPAPPAADA